MSDFASANTGVKDPEFVVPRVAMGSAQVTDPQTIQKAKGSLVPTNGDTTMGEALVMAASALDLGLATFLTRFDLLEFNSLPANHFHHFGLSYSSFLRFSMPAKGLHC